MSLQNFKYVQKFLQFPLLRTTKNGTKIVVDRLQEKDVHKAYGIFMRYAADGDGISQDEFTTVDAFRKKMCEGSLPFYCKIQDTGEYVGVFNISPSGICRSTHPIMHAGYIVLNPEIVNQGCGRELMVIYFMLGAIMGYQGIAGRTAATNPLSYLSLRRIGLDFTGYIPYSYSQKDLGWMDDGVFVMKTTIHPIWQKFNEDHPFTPPTLPPRPTAATVLPQQDTYMLPNYTPTHVTLNSGRKVVIKPVDNESDWLHVECMIHDEASTGCGSFAIDEFKDNGTWNRRLLYKSATLVMKCEESGDVVAAAIIGPSSLCRSPSPATAGIYIVVNKQYRQQNAARQLANECFRLAASEGFLMCCTDVYIHNAQAVQFAKSLGYQVHASVVCSGYFQDRGFADTLLFFKMCSPNTIMYSAVKHSML